MTTYWIQHGKEKLEFEELANIAYPCPTCGIPACGKECIFWNEKLQCIVTEGSYNDTLLAILVTKLFEDKKSISNFLKEWNDCEGWAENFGAKVSIKEIEETLTLLEMEELDKYLKDYLKELKDAFKLLLKDTEEGYLRVDNN